MESQSKLNCQNNIEKEEQSQSLIIPDFKAYCKATIIKAVQNLRKNTYRPVEENGDNKNE